MLILSVMLATSSPVTGVIYAVPNPHYQETVNLRNQNQELRRSLEALQSANKELQLRLNESESKVKSAATTILALQQQLDKLNREFQTQKENAAQTIQALQIQQENIQAEVRRQAQQYEIRLKEYAGRIRQGEQKVEVSEKLIKQMMQENQRIQRLRSQEIQQKEKLIDSIQDRDLKESRAEKLAQFYRQKADELQQQTQQQQASLAELRKQLQLTQQQAQKHTSGDELELLAKQVASLKRSLDNSRTDLDACHRQLKELSDSTDSQTKRLETYEKTARSSLSEKEECKKEITEKTAAIDKWRQSNTDLQTQLNAAITINNQLRIQLASLQAECEALKAVKK